MYLTNGEDNPETPITTELIEHVFDHAWIFKNLELPCEHGVGDAEIPKA